MRLLNTKKFVIETFDDDNIPRYAILSHTWGKEEVTFQDMQLRRPKKQKKGWAKVRGSCSRARKDRFDYLWLDTCCIDKTSSAELSEAINSMYRWYQEATVCYAFLADVSNLAELPKSKWFTRGWTLQELIAPSSMIFFSNKWKELGNKSNLAEVISDRTKISKGILKGDQRLEEFSVAQRMSWAADRRTIRREDLAYCLMGIFGINMPLLYGEGERAFIRLQEEIMKVSDDHSLFAWKHPGGRGGLFAPSPAAFKDSGNIVARNPLMPYNSPFTLTNKGVHLDLPFIGLGDRGTGLVVLSCTEVGESDKLVAIYLRDSFLTMEHFERCKSERFDLINMNKFRLAQYRTRNLCIKLRGSSQRHQGASYVKAQDDGSRERPDDQGGDKCMGMEQDHQKQLLLAASQGREAAVERLLALPNVQADSKDDQERTPLSLAAEAGHEGIVRLLLDRRDVDINSEDIQGLRPISYATIQGHEGTVWQLLARRDIDLDFGEASERTLVSLVTAGGHSALLGQLLARRDTREKFTPENCHPALCDAAKNGHDSVLRLLLNSGRVQPDRKDEQENTALWYAVVNGKETAAKLLLEIGWADACFKNTDEVTVLWHAVSGGYEETARLLLQHGADAEVPGEDGRSPLCEASSKGFSSIVQDLLTHGANVDLQRALEEACDHGHEGVVKLLLDHGATVDGSAVKLAVGGGYDGIVKLLMKKDPPSDTRDSHIYAAIIEAIEKKHSNIARTLLEAATKKRKVLYPIHLVMAVINRDLDMAKVLLDNGANANSGCSGLDLLVFAAQQGCEEIVKALLPGGDCKTVLETYKASGTLVVDRRYQPKPLWCAAINGHEALVQLLLKHNAKLDYGLSGSNGKRKPLYEATRLKYEGIERLLREHSAADSSAPSTPSSNVPDTTTPRQGLLEAGPDTPTKKPRVPVLPASDAGPSPLAPNAPNTTTPEQALLETSPNTPTKKPRAKVLPASGTDLSPLSSNVPNMTTPKQGLLETDKDTVTKESEVTVLPPADTCNQIEQTSSSQAPAEAGDQAQGQQSEDGSCTIPLPE